MSLPERIRSDLPARAPGEVLPPPRYETIHDWGEPAPVVAYRVRRPKWRGAAAFAIGAALILGLSSLPDIVGWFR